MKKKIIFCLLSLSLMIAGCQSNEIEDIKHPLVRKYNYHQKSY